MRLEELTRRSVLVKSGIPRGAIDRFEKEHPESFSKINPLDIYGFKRLEKPKSMNRQMLTRLFDLYNVSSGLLASEGTYPQALEQLLKAAQNTGNRAIELKTFLGREVSVRGFSMGKYCAVHI